MSSFIVPISSLPSISSLSKTQQNPQMTATQGAPFSDFLQQAVESMAQTSGTAKTTMYDLAMGQTDDLHNGAISAIKASTATNFTTNFVSTAIRSYNELLRMQI